MGNLEYRIITILYSLSYGQLTNTNLTWVLAVSDDGSLVVLPIRVWREEGRERMYGKGKDFGQWKGTPLCVCLESGSIFFVWYLIFVKSSTM